jgi:hypothetical protein
MVKSNLRRGGVAFRCARTPREGGELRVSGAAQALGSRLRDAWPGRGGPAALQQIDLGLQFCATAYLRRVIELEALDATRVLEAFGGDRRQVVGGDCGEPLPDTGTARTTLCFWMPPFCGH